MNRREFLDRFQLHQQHVFNDQISPRTLIESHAHKHNWHWNLAPNGEPLICEQLR